MRKGYRFDRLRVTLPESAPQLRIGCAAERHRLRFQYGHCAVFHPRSAVQSSNPQAPT